MPTEDADHIRIFFKDHDGLTYVYPSGHWLKIECQEAPETPERPASLKYSLAFFSPDDECLVRFGNSHAVKVKGRPKPETYDHWHRFGKMEQLVPYDLPISNDFWLISLKKWKGTSPLTNKLEITMKDPKRLNLGIASPAEMKERLRAAARGEYRPAPDEPKLWMAPEALLRLLLAADNRKLLTIMATERPRSVSALAELVGRDQGNVSRAIGVLANAGIVRLVQDGREKRPEVAVERLHVDIDLVHDRFALA